MNPRCSLLTLAAAVSILLAPAISAPQSSLVLDTPTDLEKLRSKVERSWRAWEAADRGLEKVLLRLSPEKASERIRKGLEGCREYYADRNRLSSALARQFREQHRLFEEEEFDPIASQASELENLERLLERRRATQGKAGNVPERPKDGRAAMVQNMGKAEAEAVEKLAKAAETRLSTLRRMESDGLDLQSGRRELAEILSSLAGKLEDHAAQLDQERAQWEIYYAELMSLVESAAKPEGKRAVAPAEQRETEAASKDTGAAQGKTGSARK